MELSHTASVYYTLKAVAVCWSNTGIQQVVIKGCHNGLTKNGLPEPFDKQAAKNAVEILKKEQ